ncbi:MULTISPECIES: hypothetical protein [unclassified Tolypothrix]|nr:MULTISPECIES: hypothetical protein [unclassified Tolypothrix]EKE96939.1 hypothetical protein FDUTEX481_06206 [Tolypothrix sp. PCC 7601]BAY89891.1 hypothetical protein NIES3275_18940 [Microchaete diplosiphon NIES-3275]
MTTELKIDVILRKITIFNFHMTLAILNRPEPEDTGLVQEI